MQFQKQMLIFNSWHTSGKSNIYAAENDGSRFRCLTSHYQLQRCQRLRISPQHSHLLFYAVPYGEETGRFFFWEFGSDRLTEYDRDPYPYDLKWLTNDKLLCIKKDRLWTANLADPSTAELDFGEPYLAIDVAPDGIRLLLKKTTGARGSIYVGDIDQQLAQEIVRGEEYEKSHSICYPSTWSPDGHTIACVGGVEDEVWLVNADGSNPRQVAKSDYFWCEFRWAPDGKKIAFTRSLDGRGPSAELGGVFVKNLQTGEEKQVLTLRRSETWRWAPDGEAIVFAKDRNDHYSLSRINIRTSSVTELIGDTAKLRDIDELIVV
jgi:Tol biopolymer transport system component